MDGQLRSWWAEWESRLPHVRLGSPQTLHELRVSRYVQDKHRKELSDENIWAEADTFMFGGEGSCAAGEEAGPHGEDSIMSLVFCDSAPSSDIPLLSPFILRLPIQHFLLPQHCPSCGTEVARDPFLLVCPSGHALSSILYNLARHPEYQLCCWWEVQELLGDVNPEEIEWWAWYFVISPPVIITVSYHAGCYFWFFLIE